MLIRNSVFEKSPTDLYKKCVKIKAFKFSIVMCFELDVLETRNAKLALH